MESKYTPLDLLRSFAAVKVVYTLNGSVITPIPKDVRGLVEKLNPSLETIHTS